MRERTIARFYMWERIIAGNSACERLIKTRICYDSDTYELETLLLWYGSHTILLRFRHIIAMNQTRYCYDMNLKRYCYDMNPTRYCYDSDTLLLIWNRHVIAMLWIRHIIALIQTRYCYNSPRYCYNSDPLLLWFRHVIAYGGGISSVQSGVRLCHSQSVWGGGPDAGLQILYHSRSAGP